MTFNTGRKEKLLRYNHQRRASLRTRISLALIITSVSAVLAVGFFAFVRNQTTQTFLGDQLQASTQENAESQINSIAKLEAQRINKFFEYVDQSAITTATYSANLLNQAITFEEGIYWNAEQKLHRLPSGTWDNPTRDAASIFASKDFELTKDAVRELNAIIQLDLVAPGILQDYPNVIKDYPNIVAIYYISSKDVTVYYPNIDLANVVPPDFKATEQPFYTIAASLSKNTSAWTHPYQDPALTGLIVTNSSPVYDNTGHFRGVVGVDVQLARVTSRVLDIEIGETGFAFLIDSESRIIAMPSAGYELFNLTPEVIAVNETPQQKLIEQVPADLHSYFQSMTQGDSSLNHVQIQGVEYFLAYVPISSPNYSLGILVPVREMDIAVRQSQALVAEQNQETQNYGVLLLVTTIIAALLVSFGLSQVLTNPLNRLTTTAQKVSEGDLTAVAPETNVSELNVLSTTFNAMTSQLKGMLGSLEERVAERTSELDEVNLYNQRRAEQFEAVAQVARDISSSQDLATLLPKITNVISERFEFYHVGVFLVDTNQEYAVLRAANSAGGLKMLERKHRLKIGETGIVGYATSQNKARVALDTGKDAVYFDNPDLPNTRSEMALPLRIGNLVIGALDVQSTESDAFSQEDIEILSTLADQVSVAIQNARLYEETRNALEQSQALQQEFIRTGWSQFTHAQKLMGFRHSDDDDAILIKSAQDIEDVNGNNILELPINLRNQTIGMIKLRPKEEHHWSQDEIDIATAILERAAIAMENARLLSEAQRRAARERVIGDISASISTSSDMEGILRTAVQVLGRRMGGAEVVLELGTESDRREDAN